LPGTHKDVNLGWVQFEYWNGLCIVIHGIRDGRRRREMFRRRAGDGTKVCSMFETISETDVLVNGGSQVQSTDRTQHLHALRIVLG
jgi:hypothetical protein